MSYSRNTSQSRGYFIKSSDKEPIVQEPIIQETKKEKRERATIINIDSRYRDIKNDPHVNNFTMNFPKTFSNVSEIGISSLELPNTISVFNNRNNKIRWKNQWGYGHINSVYITSSDPVTGSAPGGSRTDKFVKFTVDGSVKNEISVGDVVKIVGLYINNGTDATKLYGGATLSHLIGNSCMHATTSNSHSGKITSVDSSTVVKVLPNHYYSNSSDNSTYTTWRKWGTSGDNQNGEPNDYYNNWKLVMTSGSAKNEVRRVSDYVGSTRAVTIESAFSTSPAVNDTYQLLKESYMVYKGPGDTISGGTVAYNEFWIIDYITTASPAHNTTGNGATEMGTLPHTYSSSYGIWYHDRDENNNYSTSTQNIVNFASIGSKARWFTESSNSFGKALSDSMSIAKYPNDEVPKFDIKLNDNNEMITIIQKYLNRPSRWLKYWVYEGAQLGGPLFTVAGENIVSFVLPSNGFEFGNILGVVRYPPTDSYNNWTSTSLENGWPASDLQMDLYGCAMIITGKSVVNWGEKNKFEKDMEIELINTGDSRLNGVHRIKYVPKVGYRLNSGNSAPCYCFVVPIYIDTEIPSTYSTIGSSSILSTNINGTWGMRIEIIGSTGLSGTQLEHINRKHTIIGKGIIKDTTSSIGYTYDTDPPYYNDTINFKLNSVPTASNFAGGGGLKAMLLFERPFKFIFKDYIDDLGPNLGLTDGNNRKDTDEWVRSLSNTYDKTIYTDVKIPSKISGDNYFYISINNLEEQGYHSEYSAIHDNKYSGGHILTKVLITMGSGEMLFNTQIGGKVGGKSAIMTFDRPIRNLDKISIGLYRKLSNIESQTDLEKYLKKSYEVSLTIRINKIRNKSIDDISNGLVNTIMQLKNKDDLISHIILGKGNDKTRNEKWQFYIDSIKADASFSGYLVIMKIYPQREVYFDRISSLDIPIDPIDIANYIYKNIPTTSAIHPSDDMIYLRNIISIDKVKQVTNPPKGFDYLDINNVDYSMSLSIIENV